MMLCKSRTLADLAMIDMVTVKMPKLYFAAPLFNQAELQFNASLKSSLSKWFQVWLPQEDGGLIAEMIAGGMPPKAAARKVFMADIQAIKDCDVLLILLDGRTVDEGSCFELGYAFALGKICVGLQTDTRRLLPSGNSPMLERSCKHIFTSVKDLEAWAAVAMVKKKGGNNETRD